MNESRHKLAVDRRRVAYFIFALVVGVAAAAFGSSWIHENSEARSVIATAFSVLAGFLVAVIAVQADERMIRGASWRSDFYRLEDVKRRLIRHRDTFQLYLLVLVLVFVLSLRIAMPYWLQNLLERGTLFLSVVAFILSFRIPEHLMRGYIEHLEQCVGKERARGAR